MKIDRPSLNAKALHIERPGCLLRTRGTSDIPLWCFRSQEDMRREVQAWQNVCRLQGLVPGRTMVVSLLNADIERQLVQGALAHGLRVVAVPPTDLLQVVMEVNPAYAVMAPLAAFRLLLRGALSSLSALWLSGDVTGMGALVRRIEEFSPDTTVRDVYSVVEYPGPLAISCPGGRWHWLADDIRVEFVDSRGQRQKEEEKPSAICLARHGDSPGVLDAYPLDDLTIPYASACPCGMDSPLTTSPVMGRVSEIRTLDNGYLTTSHLAQAWYSTEGLSDRFDAKVIWDETTHESVLSIRAAVLQGYDRQRTVARFEDWLVRSLGSPIRVEVQSAADLWPDLTLHIDDERPYLPERGGGW